MMNPGTDALLGRCAHDEAMSKSSAASDLVDTRPATMAQETLTIPENAGRVGGIFDLVLRAVMGVTGASDGVLLSPNGKANEYYVASSRSDRESQAHADIVEVDDALGERLREPGESRLVYDRDLLCRVAPLLGPCVPEGDSFAALLLSYQGHLTGIVVLRAATAIEAGATGGGHIVLEQAGALLALTGELATVQNQVSELSALAALTTTPVFVDNWERLVGRVVDRVHELVGAERVCILLLDPTSNTLVAQLPAIGFRDDEVLHYRLPLAGGGLAVRVFKSGRAFWTNDPMSDPDGIQYWMKLHKPRNIICVPLEVEGTHIGLVYASNKINGELTPADAHLVSVLSSYLGVLLQNARLFDIEHRAFLEAKELNTIVKRQEEDLRRILKIHDEFTQAVLGGQGVMDVLETLHRIVPNPIMVEDSFSNILAQYPPDEDFESDPGRIWTLASEVHRLDRSVRTTFDVITHSRQPRRIAPIPELGFEKPRVVAPLSVGNKTLGFVSVLESHRSLDALDIMAVQQAATALSLQMMKEQAAAQAQYKLLEEFVAELLAGGHGSRSLVMNRAAYLGINLSAAMCVLVVGVDRITSGRGRQRPKEQISAIIEGVRSVVERVCARSARGSVVAYKGEELVVLANFGEVSGGTSETTPQQLAEAILREAKSWLPRTVLSVGIGCVCGEVDQYQISYQQARNALSVINASGRSDCVLSFEKLGLLGLMLESSNHEALLSLADGEVGKLREYDVKYSSDLLATLEGYLACDCRLAAAASTLHVHPNTLRYRLKRIEQVLGASLDSPDEKLNLQFALRVLRLFERK